MSTATKAFLGEIIKESARISLLPRVKYEFYNFRRYPITTKANLNKNKLCIK